MNYRLVCKQFGLLLLVLAGSMLVPVAWEFQVRRGQVDPANEPLLALCIAIGIAIVGGWFLCHLGRRQRADLRRKEALLLVATSWFFGAAFAALPFRIWAFLQPAGNNVDPAFGSWINCYFEAMSGLTTTGATILTRIATIPESLLLWRCMTQWLGGLGIVVLFVAVLPMLGVGGKRLFRVESPGPTSEGVTPRIRSTAQMLWFIYFTFTIVQTLLLHWQGFTWFESICHTFTTLSTGGFSTQDTSVGGFNNAGAELIIIVFMILAGANFGLYYQIAHRKWHATRGDPELLTYLLILTVSTLIVIVSVAGSTIITTPGTEEQGLTATLRHSVFQVVSIMTTTGFCTADFHLWPFAAKALLVGLMFVGGSGGSTAGGIKVVRCIIAVKVLWAEIERIFRPHVVRSIRVGTATVDPDLRLATMVYIVGIFVVFGIGTFGVMYFEPAGRISITTAATATAATLNNIGPGLHEVGARETYAHFGAMTKCLLSLLMVVGRLELFTILVLLMPKFWRSE